MLYDHFNIKEAFRVQKPSVDPNITLPPPLPPTSVSTSIPASTIENPHDRNRTSQSLPSVTEGSTTTPPGALRNQNVDRSSQSEAAPGESPVVDVTTKPSGMLLQPISDTACEIPTTSLHFPLTSYYPTFEATKVVDRQ